MTDLLRGSRNLIVSSLIIATAALAACGDTATSPGGGDEPDPDPDPQSAVCDWIGLSQASAMPADSVEVGAVPDSFAAPVWVEVRVPEDTTTGYTWVEPGEGGVSFMPAPVHPLGDPEGGAVELTVTDGTHACPTVDFEIDALPEAPGTFAAVVDSLVATIAVQAELLGTTAETLAAASMDTLGADRYPVAIAQRVISHPDNPNSMTAIAAGTSEAFGEADLTITDRLLARTGFLASVSAHLAYLRGVAASVPSPSADAGAVATSAPVLAQSDNPADYDCSDITTAFELDLCMEEARSAASVLDGATGKVANDMGKALGVAGLVPHGGVQMATAGLGAALWAAQIYYEGRANTLPSELAELTFDLTKEEFLEDEEGSGQWQNAMLTATSNGWELDKAILEGIIQVAGMSSTFKGFLDGEAAELGMKEILEYIRDELVSEAIDAATQGEDVLRIPPETFGPIPIDDAEWSESEVDALGVLALTDRMTYEPRKSGTGYVIVQNVEGTFADQTRRTERPVEVRRIQIAIQPTSEQADPGQVFAFDATVENAAHPDALEVSASQGEIINVTYEGDGLHTIEYAAPETDDFHDFITARHTANTGARAYSDEPRLAQADIYSKAEVVVDPFATCLELDQDTTFSAEVVGLENQSVTWEIVEGTGEIDAGGTFTPTEPGYATVRATSVADTTLTGEATVSIGGCDCWWNVNVTGVPAFGDGTMDSWSLGYTASATSLFAITGNGSMTDGTVGYFFVYPEDAEQGAPLAPGSFSALVGGSLGTTQPTQFGTDTLAFATAALVEADSARVEGTVTGPVIVADYPYDDINTYIGTFQAAFRITPEVEQDQGGGITEYFCNSQSGT